MRWPVIALVAASVIAVIAPARAADARLPGFHAPQTEAERALDAILKSAGKDAAELDNLLEGRGKPGFRPTVDYRRVLTDALLRAIRDAEAALGKRDCDGAYRDGDICGLDYDPLVCAQDTAARYLYRTDAQQADTARISYAWPDQSKLAATYQLVRTGGRWKLDGIRCGADVDAGEGDAFNMK